MKKYIYALLIVGYVILSVFIINYASNSMVERNFSILASKAKDMAILAANSYHLYDAELDDLKNTPYSDLYHHPANIRLERMFTSGEGFKDVQYVYVMAKLPPEQIKYHVTEEYNDYFETTVGTPLDIMWFVDIVVGKGHNTLLDEDPGYFDDIRRYSYSSLYSPTMFDDREPFYEMTTDEFGSVISGVAPFYTQEGTFVGMMGIDIFFSEYEQNANFIRLLLLTVFLLPSVGLSVAYLIIYIINLRKSNITAYTDPLTSVKNRRYMEKHLSQNIREHFKKQLPLSVIMIDIDFFKRYNDNYGHQAGDDVLINVTKTVAASLRTPGDVVCRYGGEEFLIILPNTGAAAAERVAERVRISINKADIRHEHSDVADHVTISQGVYSAVPPNINCGELFISYADKGLYEAKETGRNKYVRIRA